MRILQYFAIALLLIAGGFSTSQAAEEKADSAAPSRAAWWLAQDEVEPIADLINLAAAGTGTQFVDRVGNFKVSAEDRALIITGDFPEPNIWRFDLSTYDDQFDMRTLYVKLGDVAYPDKNSIWTKKHTQLLGDEEKGLTFTGPWDIFGGKWMVPTARVALDGRHIYTSWFDLPSLADQNAGRVYTSFALDITKPGKHTIRISFDDFAHGTRWRMPRWDNDDKPEVTYDENPLRPENIGSIAIGIDERVRALEDISIKPELKGKHPRLSGTVTSPPKPGPLSIKDVEEMIVHCDFNRGELWEYSIDAESMASENDMDAGKKGHQAARSYDQHVLQLDPAARKEWDRVFLERFQGMYTFFVFQRNYHPTGYAQNHSSATVPALLAAGIVWDGPEAEKWLRWGVMTCRKHIELYGRDGGLEWMNESRSYGLAYFLTPMRLIKDCTGVDLTAGEPFFQNEWRYALHQSPGFPMEPGGRPVMLYQEHNKNSANVNVPIPISATIQNTPTNQYFDDVDQVFMRSDWGCDGTRVHLMNGSVFGKAGSKIAKRYNWAHCRVNQGSFTLGQGQYEIILEAGRTRTYRKSAGNNNCILVNDTDQWGGGQVWHPRLEPDQLSRIVHFADGRALSTARTDLLNAYPPEAKLKAISRCLVHIKPGLFLVFDRVETDGEGKVEWRYHAAFVEPQTAANTYTAFAYNAPDNQMQRRGENFEQVYQKNPDVSCPVAFLTPRVTANVANTDAYFRWGKFPQPPRHLKVVQQGTDTLTLLTAFGEQADQLAGENVYRSPAGNWVALAGPGKSDGLESDAYFAIAVKRPGGAEVMRFGGTKLVYQGVDIPSSAEDVFVEIQNGKVANKIETLK